MEPLRTPRPWGNMTVGPLFGWQFLLFLLLLLVVLVVAFFVITAAGPASSERQDWQQFLEGRSSRPQGTIPGDPAAAEDREAAQRTPVLGSASPSAGSDEP